MSVLEYLVLRYIVTPPLVLACLYALGRLLLDFKRSVRP